MLPDRNIQSISEIICQDLDQQVDRYIRSGYRMAMILPSDAPREVLMTRDSEFVKLKSKNRQRLGNVEWVTGRAGMKYRDLIPDRLGGKLIASHIRIVNGGELPDSVHYHKIDFQVIYCLKGSINVVYEGQGPPFWLRPGDCILQPPEIRHRVLNAEAGSEVIEITSPAEHETWFDHDLELPTSASTPGRIFGTQQFLLHRDDEESWESITEDKMLFTETNIGNAGRNAPFVSTLRSSDAKEEVVIVADSGKLDLTILIGGRGLRLQTAVNQQLDRNTTS